ncbi:hypothetical protein MES5069_460022 [Mesorhizobium escarrei]|uniref:Uncharacterized protein n=1 Tax=Mesorhizobium escarrei TaxID=666018 RepID=A0ABN8K4M0_9HYPH|nr:hypothetical protein MES5069_460022 [Mesorhizobium escarrei]
MRLQPAVPKGAAGSQQGRNVIAMSNREIGASQALRMRVADLNENARRPDYRERTEDLSKGRSGPGGRQGQNRCR